MRPHNALGAATAAVLTVILGACASGQHTIVYKVTTDGKATINYTLGGTPKQEEISSDWTKEQKLGGTDAAAVGVVASMQGATSVTCEILVDGKSVSMQSGSGLAASAVCSTVQ